MTMAEILSKRLNPGEPAPSAPGPLPPPHARARALVSPRLYQPRPGGGGFGRMPAVRPGAERSLSGGGAPRRAVTHAVGWTRPVRHRDGRAAS